ncbi:unnamed protein product [Mycena citricolor]|uniref:Magnesium transporter n=1 Tax=Mycena citricolor TaxID=2018698 RepID=A0AAD2GX91_9AGAR|nr:unnamed protein product [Mycena citricolor]
MSVASGSDVASQLEVASDMEVPKSPVYGNDSQHSLRSRSKRSLHVHHPIAPPLGRPIDVFRRTVQKVIAMQRSTTILASAGAGAEPGIDPRRASMEVQYRSVHKDCTIEVVDYSVVSANFYKMKNAEFVDWIGRSKRPHWVKVRWIHVSGLSWDVIKALSLKHELHPLALEDVLHTRPENLSKAEYFLKHLFLRILIHEVEDENTKRPDEFTSDLSAPYSKNAVNERQIEQAKIDALKQGTVISIAQNSPADLTLPIVERLRRTDTILRSSSDPSLLVQSLISLIVDKAVQVIDAYHDQISELERQILIKPKPNTVRKLHIVSGDLVLHKRTLDPIKTLVYGLRRYDVDRCAALVDESDPRMKGKPIVGFMSHKSKIYLADVYDHTEYILSTLDMISGIGDSLTDYSFNMASYSMNDSMRLLTMITIICLPLTFVSGYFGMNFTNSGWILNPNQSDSLFWIISLPSVAVISTLFIIPDIKRMIGYFRTRKLLHLAARPID